MRDASRKSTPAAPHGTWHGNHDPAWMSRGCPHGHRHEYRHTRCARTITLRKSPTPSALTQDLEESRQHLNGGNHQSKQDDRRVYDHQDDVLGRATTLRRIGGSIQAPSLILVLIGHVRHASFAVGILSSCIQLAHMTLRPSTVMVVSPQFGQSVVSNGI